MTTATDNKDVKSAKDALIASLFELAKAANDVSNNTINFFNLSTSNDIPYDLAQFAAAATAATTATANDLISVASTNTPVKKSNSTKKESVSHTTAASTANNSSTSNASTNASTANTQNNGSTPVVVVTTPTAPVKRKHKIPRDPNAPKKPLTSYLLFCNSIRRDVSAEHPEYSQVEIAQEVARQWKTLEDDVKQHWKDEYEKDKVKYDSAMIKYNANKDSAITVADSLNDLIVEEPIVEEEEQPKKKKSKKSKKKKHDD